MSIKKVALIVLLLSQRAGAAQERESIPQEILDRFDAAQRDAGIPQGERARIKWLDSELAKEGRVGESFSDGSIGIAPYFKILPEEIQNMTARHEVCHKLYNDSDSGLWLASFVLSGMGVGAYYSTYPAIKSPDATVPSVARSLWPLLLPAVIPVYKRSIERRADIQGAYASKCWWCVTKYGHIMRSSSEHAQRFKTGMWCYLCQEEFYVIAGQLLKQSADNICAYHQSELQEKPDLAQEMVYGRAIVMAALDTHIKNQENSFYNRSKKLVVGVTSLFSHIIRRVAQPRSGVADMCFNMQRATLVVLCSRKLL